MVTTLNSQPLAASEPETPNQLEWLADKNIVVNDALEILGKKADITFPLRDEKESPAKRIKSPTHEIKNLFSALFYNDRHVLVQKVETFFDLRALWINQQDEKIKLLHDVLSTAWADVKSVKSARASRVTTGKHTSSPLHSPTMSVKHAPSAETEAIDEIQLPAPTRIVSNTTSNNTSFANTSFWSEAQKHSQDPPSPATTIDDSFHSTQEYGSSLSEGAVSKFSAKLRAAYHTNDAMQLDGANDIVTPTQETYYGSSPHPSQCDLGNPLQSFGPPGNASTQAGLGKSLDAVAADSSATTASKRSMTEAMESSVTTMDKPMDALVLKSADVSPTKCSESAAENVRVRNIVQDGLTDIHLPPSILKLDIDRRSAFYMVAQDCNIDPGDLAQQWKGQRTLSSLHKIACKHVPGFRPFSSYTDRCLRAKMHITDSREGRLLTVEHVRAQKQPSNQLEDKHGCHRFLAVDVDRLKPPDCLGLAGQTENIGHRFQEMIMQIHEFLGWKWELIYAQEKTKRKFGEGPIQFGAMQYVFFAIEGRGLKTIPVREVLSEVLHFPLNEHQPVCKLSARLDLTMSRTHAVQMHPFEIGFMGDTCANEEHSEDTQYNDPALDFRHDFKEKTVMNDGCCEAHERLFHRICIALGLDEVPTAVQIRCAGCKGIIILRRPEGSAQANIIHDRAGDPDPSLGPLVYFTESMRKVMFPEGYFDDTLFQPHLAALRVVQVVHALKPSYLYSDFLPILTDRHVPKHTLEDLAAAQAEQEVQEFLDALSSGDQLRSWLYNQYAAREEGRRDSEIKPLAGFPDSPAEKAIQMLDSGFEPTESQVLAQLTETIGTSWFNQSQRAYKIPLPRSTMALGVVDFKQLLKPGEAMCCFSQGFRDPITGRRIHHLEGAGLVARLPSNRNSDIQKVTFVYIPELAHLVDQVIFPTTGPRPLAGKCSGGDYDGDKFWLCWDQSIVEPFLNAPAPSSLPDPESMGIKIDNVKTSEIVSHPLSDEQVREFIRRGTENRMRGTLLGTITKLLERQGYADNSISTAKYRVLCDLKDLIIDSDKNGYIFTFDDLAKFKKDHGIGILPDPAYWQFTGGEKDRARKYADPNPSNILDKIHCIILPEILKNGLDRMKTKLADTPSADESLSKEYEDRLKVAENDKLLHQELTNLQYELATLKTEWRKFVDIWKAAKPTKKSLAWETAVLRSRALLDAIQPTNTDHPTVAEWLRQSGSAPTTWELIKASALAKFHNQGKMWFTLAGNELCWLKARETGSMRPILTAKYTGYKPRKRKRVAEEVVEEDDAGEVEQDDVEM